MKQLLIIGARGYGRHTFDLAKEMSSFGSEFVVKGFLDDNTNALEGYDGYPPILDSVEHYTPVVDDTFVCALGDVYYKKKYVDIVKNKGGSFFSIVPSSVRIGSNSNIGQGCIIGYNSIVDCDVTIGDFVCIQENVLIGHDTIIGDFSMIDSFSFTGGFSSIGKEVTVHTSSVIVPRITIGDNSIINAGSVVIRDVKSGCTMMGNPAKEMLIPQKIK